LLAFLLFLSNELAVAGGPAVVGFPAVDGVLAVASVPANRGVPFLGGGFTHWTVLRYITRLSDFGYRTFIFFAAIGLSEYRISDWRIQETTGSRSQSIGYRTQNYPAAHLW
jgi:hypothetical protein